MPDEISRQHDVFPVERRDVGQQARLSHVGGPQGRVQMKEDDIPVVGLMVDLETAQIAFVAQTKLATPLECWCPSCRRDLPDADADPRDRVRERPMEITEALDEQMDTVQLDAALPPDAMKH